MNTTVVRTGEGLRMIVPLRDAVPADSGGKAGALGVLLRAGLPVPDGFVIPFEVRRAAVPAPDRGGVPDLLRDALTLALDGLGDAPLAVRSSATGEDTGHASAAGQYASVLAVRGVAGVLEAVRTCWDSLHGARANSYRSGPDDRHQLADPEMAVLVQRLVDAEVSGVMFTAADPLGTVAIEASWGLGPSVVEGAVTPDSYRVAADGTITRALADKRTRLDRDDAPSASGLLSSDVPATDRQRPTLDDADVVRLVRLGQQAAALLGRPLDIEWALGGTEIWILQARPITAPLPTESAQPAASGVSLTGTPAGHGVATGVARIINGPSDFPRVGRGDILLCHHTDPAWTPLLRIVAGVVTETGGVLAHAAIIARELRIPAVVAVPNATSTIRDGAVVTIDGGAGTVIHTFAHPVTRTGAGTGLPRAAGP